MSTYWDSMHNCKVAVVVFGALLCFYLPYATATSGDSKDGIVTSRNYDLESAENATNAVREGVTQQADCNCKNGYCVRNGKSMECRCPPALGRVGDNYCMDCRCGAGFNCSFFGTKVFERDFRKVCHCTEGFKGDYSCKAKCNATHPCQNGGRCVNELCDCNTDSVYGDFCQHIFKCDSIFNCFPRTEVDCVYDLEKSDSKCLCKNRSLVYDGEERRCRPCPCGKGTCGSDYLDRLVCNCDPGYVDLNKRCRPCDCGNGGYCTFNDKAEPQCKCPDGTAERQGRCILCECGLGRNDIKCVLNGTRKHCLCPEGFEDRLGVCEDIDECQQKDVCPPGLVCNNTIGSFRCQCEEGSYFKNPNNHDEGCMDMDECWMTDYCKGYEVECVNLPGTYKCKCKEGYQPASFWTDPRKTTCVEYKESWLPTILALVILAVLIIAGIGVTKYLQIRRNNSQSNIPVAYSKNAG